MRTPSLNTPLDGVLVHPVRTECDITAFWEWFQTEHVVGIDTETCGLAFHDNARLVQIANATEAWVLDAHRHPDIIDELVFGNLDLIAHNASFDAIVLGRLATAHSTLPLDEVVMGIMGRTEDTRILSHLIDPRAEVDGGIGHSLKPLCDHYLGAEAVDGQRALKERFRTLGLTMTTGWRLIDQWDTDYVRYAGIDPVLTMRLHQLLAPMVAEMGMTKLARFEHDVATVTAAMTCRGMKVDVPHARATLAHVMGEQTTAESTLRTYGVNNCQSPKQVAEALMVRGVELTAKTDNGAWRVDRKVLDAIDDPVATLVKRAKQASKAASSWLMPILDHAAKDGRCHARINPLKARTGRMSVSDPALQQLPTGDWRIRRCLVADEHQSIVCVDFSQVEVRVMAYLSDERTLIDAFGQGLDVHSTIARRLYGDDFTPDQRQRAKQAIFGKLYGQSARAMAANTGVSEVVARQTMAGLDRSFPRMARWSSRIIQRAKFHGGEMTTPSGRRLPADPGREYALVNHLVQGCAGDVFKSALLAVAKEHSDRLLLPVHDELILQCDEHVADEFGMAIAELMGGQLGDVPLVAEYKVAGPSWGHLYRPATAHA